MSVNYKLIEELRADIEQKSQDLNPAWGGDKASRRDLHAVLILMLRLLCLVRDSAPAEFNQPDETRYPGYGRDFRRMRPKAKVKDGAIVEITITNPGPENDPAFLAFKKCVPNCHPGCPHSTPATG